MAQVDLLSDKETAAMEGVLKQLNLGWLQGGLNNYQCRAT